MNQDLTYITMNTGIDIEGQIEVIISNPFAITAHKGIINTEINRSNIRIGDITGIPDAQKDLTTIEAVEVMITKAEVMITKKEEMIDKAGVMINMATEMITKAMVTGMIIKTMVMEEITIK